MKTLQIIQKLSKIGKILCKIVFILCIVGFCFCAVGIASLALGAKTVKIGSITMESLIKTEAELTMGTLYASMIVAMILCSGKAVLAKYAEHYFRGEIEDGSPFNQIRAAELKRLGILTICIPIGTQIIAETVYDALSHIWNNAAPLELDNSGSVALGIMFIVLSLICRYGAECQKGEV